VTEERNPELRRASSRFRCRLVEGTEVRPSRALEAFWRCEQTWARFTSDILRVRWRLSVELEVRSPRGRWGELHRMVRGED